MKNKKKILWTAVSVICALIVIAGTVMLILANNAPDVTRDDFSADQTEAALNPDSATEAPVQAPTALPLEKSFGYELAEYTDIGVDFEKLTAANPDVYAWIYIPNTNVDYPVVRSISDGDDTFYLDHNVYRQYQFSGTIFSELSNNPDFHDPVTVLYGHNMLDGSMFASLHNFEKDDFFEENRTAFVVTADKVYTYLIYSAYTYDDRHILRSFLADDSESFREYLESTLDPHSYDSQVRENVVLDTDSRILTLSTCTNGASNIRYLVQGVLVDEFEKEKKL